MKGERTRRCATEPGQPKIPGPDPGILIPGLDPGIHGGPHPGIVIPGLDPGIHGLTAGIKRGVGRVRSPALRRSLLIARVGQSGGWTGSRLAGVL